jgi:hypothetical protein
MKIEKEREGGKDQRLRDRKGVNRKAKIAVREIRERERERERGREKERKR